MDSLKEDLKEVKADIKELIRQGAYHNELLRTHEARSLALQQMVEAQAKELEPVKKHVDIVNMLGKAALAILTSAAAYILGRLVI